MITPAISNIINLIDDYTLAFSRYYHNDNPLIDDDLCRRSSELKLQIIDSLSLLEKGVSK